VLSLNTPFTASIVPLAELQKFEEVAEVAGGGFVIFSSINFWK
jgi:hypothetical protein